MRVGFASSAVGLLLVVSGCVTYAPKYNDVIFQKLSLAGTELTKIGTLIKTRAAQKVSYTSVEGFYVSALAFAREAQDIAEQRPAYLDGQPAAEAARISAENIKACREAIEFSRHRFETAGPARNELDNIAIIKNICAIPKTMEGLLK